MKVPEPEGSNPVGVDVGINNLLAASNGFRVNGKPIEHRRRHFRRLRGSLQSKGTSSARRKLKRLAGRERRWINTVLHQVSRAFVNSLVAGRNVVVMERLDGIRQRCKQRKEQRATIEEVRHCSDASAVATSTMPITSPPLTSPSWLGGVGHPSTCLM